MTYKDMREYKRNVVAGNVTVNDGYPYHGGTLVDLSFSGAAVMYSPEAAPTSEPIIIGQTVILKFHGRKQMPGRVTRIFNDGFAVNFDFLFLMLA